MDRSEIGINKMKKQANIKKQNSRSRGETLVETIVSFSVLFLLLFSVTLLVKSAINMHNRALASAAALELTCTEIESNHGTLKGTGTLHIRFPEGSDPAIAEVSVGITVRQQDELVYFTEGGN